MPEHLKVLVIVLSAGVAVFWAGERILCPQTVQVADFRRRRNAWLGVVLIAFLAHNFWIAAFLTGWLTFYLARRDPNPLALYLTVLLAVPWYSMEIPGFGLVNYFVTLNHYKVINLAVLLPLVLSRAPAEPASLAQRWTNWALAAYLVYTEFMLIPARTMTGSMRGVVDIFITVAIPYIAFSRMCPSGAAVREVISGFVVGAAVLGVVAPFESLKGWLVYESLREPLGIAPPDLLTYLFRGGEGLLRANGSVGNSIVLGYVMMLAMLLSIALFPGSGWRKWALIAPLVAGLVFALSRGPWIGCAVGLLILVFVRKASLRALVSLSGASVTLVLAFQFVPQLHALIEFLPFLGSVDDHTVSYRQQLFEVGMVVFREHPIFGAIDYITNPVMEQMRQGQGIIDMVNSYLGVALAFGAVGLLLFCLPFGLAIFCAARGLGRCSSPGCRKGNASLLAAVVGAMLTIATVSSIGAVAPLYWMLIALAVRFGSSFAQALSTRSGQAKLGSTESLVRG